MGDRTTVYLTFPKVLKEEVDKIFENDPPEEQSISIYSSESGLMYYTFYEVNYGNLEGLDQLISMGIPFESEWGAGDGYGPSVDYCRFTPEGELVRKVISDSYKAVQMDDLMERIYNPDELRQFILNLHEEITVLPWYNQIEYGKIHRTKQLISPT